MAKSLDVPTKMMAEVSINESFDSNNTMEINSSSTSIPNGISPNEANCFTSSEVDVTPHSDTNAIDFAKRITCCGASRNDRFFKGCKWSPDDIGNRILTCDGGNRLRIYHSFLNRMNYTQSQISDDIYELRNVGNIYDYDWYPAVTPSEYYVTAASSLGPLHIFDLITSKTISSYHMYNTNDEMIHAHSVACSPDGGSIIGGTADYLFLFDIQRPGRTYERIQIRPHFRRGIISTITVNPSRYSMFAVGSYNDRIGIYDGRQLLCLLFGHVKGITHLKFSSDGLLLYSGTRGNSDIICWDLRNPGTALYKLERVVQTQQRIYFDITPDGRFIISGCTDGDVYIWDSTIPPDGNVLLPVHKLKAHVDCTNGVSIHHELPFFTTVSGQYHHTEWLSVFEDSGSEVDSREDFPYFQEENSLKLWHIDF